MKQKSEMIDALLSIYQDILSDSGNFFVMMIDLCGSTEYKQISRTNGNPDSDWVIRELIFLRSTAKIIENYDGQVVKTVGDAVIAIFESSIKPENVLKCAIESVQLFQDSDAFGNKVKKIIVKAALDYGETYNGNILSADIYDPIGSCVDRCARLESIAEENQIVLSNDFKEKIEEQIGPRRSPKRYGYIEHIEDLKGFGETPYFVISA